ncbi:MAG TPA: class I SAM-dependent methyltransferase [Silvibacterium sp.]|nr:class I SAM-dependent methyltransferase [Silvibacterium sp.]
MQAVMPPKTRSYEVDTRHFLPMVRDFSELITLRLFAKRKRRHVIQLGRDVRQRAFDARDTLPVLEHADIASFLGCAEPPRVVLPPIDVISLAGLGFAVPYALLGTVAGALRPKIIFETGTFRGVGTLTLALNAPDAEIYTVDLPKMDEAGTSTLTKGDKEWVRLSRGCTGAAFEELPEAARIHQIWANSLTMNAAEIVTNVDLFFIDGGHSYECVKADTENALKVLSPNGVILWDDYTWFMEGVRGYLNELRASLPLKRIAGSQYVIYKRGA